MKESTIHSINPATGKIEKTFNEMSDAQIAQIIDQADAAFQTWKKTSFIQRKTILKRAAAIFVERKEELAKLITMEMGRVFNQSVSEILFGASILNYYADHGEEFLKDTPVGEADNKTFISYEPIGTLLSVQPWNFPFYQILRTAAPNIMAGNAYILKHASNVPQCAEAMEKVFRDAGLPQGVFTNIFMRGSRVDALLANPKIKAATLTGSSPAGSSIAQAAGKYLKKTTLELGGSDPYIVLEDADIDKAVKGAIIGRFSNAGQICISSKRIILVESIANEFIEKFKAQMAELKVGNPLDPTVAMGPLSSEKALQKVLEQVNQSIEQGAQLLMGGKRINGVGAFMEPTLLSNIQPGTVAYTEEIFGPVALLFIVKDETDAVQLANDTEFGLGGSVYSENEERAVRVAKQIESGMVCINAPTSIALAIDIPFGGTKNSGYGRDHQLAGIREFVNEKTIRIL